MALSTQHFHAKLGKDTVILTYSVKAVEEGELCEVVWKLFRIELKAPEKSRGL